MFKFKQIRKKALLLLTLLLFSGIADSCLTPAYALGQKPVRDASYYVQTLNETQKINTVAPPPPPMLKILAKCGEQKRTTVATGILIFEDGRIFGYKHTEPIKFYNPTDLLATDKGKTDKIFAYADSIKLNEIAHNNVPDGASQCGIDYLYNSKTHVTRWPKHPYLREDYPPPQELLLLFEAINNVALGKEPFADDPSKKVDKID